MPNTIKFSDNPNEETAFVTTEDDTRTRVVLTTPVDGTVKFPDNPNSTKVSVTVDGVARKAVAVYNLGGGGGSDPHNLGYYATQSALESAHPTGSDGDFAVVGSTDTIWVWDSDSNAWKDTDTKGQVTSVNGQTGAVTLTIPDAIQVDTMPTAGADELGKVYQFIGTTGTYTHGYFYECVSDGQTPATYSWSQLNVQPTPSGLPSQTGNSGKFLTTDGTDASWSDTFTEFVTFNGVAVNNSAEMGYITIKTTQKNTTNTKISGSYGGSGNDLFISATTDVKVKGSLYPKSSTTYNLGKSTALWETAYITKINNGDDITVPAVAGTMAVVQVNTTATLTSAGWSGGSQTITVTGVTATGIVFVSPDPTDQAAYTSAGIIATAQSTDSITFTCTSTPSADIDVVVIML